jgi:GntR family transcriptional regulator, transcriptional repressor for pyruvate dehydrogenase complex
MLHMMRAMFDLLREGVFYNRQMMFRHRATRELLLEQHREMNDAVQARDPDRARAAIEAHLNYVEATLGDLRTAERHEEIAQQRFEHAQSL